MTKHDEYFSPLANGSTTLYRGNQLEKTSSGVAGKNDDSRREKKLCQATCYGLLSVFVTFSSPKYCFPSIVRGLYGQVNSRGNG